MTKDMKKQISLLTLAIFLVTTAFASESKCLEIAEREYPSDSRMQQYTYKKQLSAYRYMESAAKETDVLEIALREYPEDYSMQKYTYDKQSPSPLNRQDSRNLDRF